MTHQSASTVNEMPAAAAQRTLRRAFFPTEGLYFEVHLICLTKINCKINEEKTENNGRETGLGVGHTPVVICRLQSASWQLLELNYYRRMEFRERRPTITSDAISTSC